MLKLDLIVLNYIFPWNDYALYGIGIYAKFIIVLLVFEQCFNIVYVLKKKKGGGNK